MSVEVVAFDLTLGRVIDSTGRLTPRLYDEVFLALRRAFELGVTPGRAATLYVDQARPFFEEL